MDGDLFSMVSTLVWEYNKMPGLSTNRILKFVANIVHHEHEAHEGIYKAIWLLFFFVFFVVRYFIGATCRGWV